MTAISTPAAANNTILIVDDTPANLGVLVNYLEQLGFDVVTAQDGEEAVLRAQFVHPDLILLDIMMPGIDGYETCRRLKALDSIKDIPVIFMTALTDTKKKVEGFDAGGVDFITKPFQIEEVSARIRAHLRLQALQRQLTLQNVQLQHEIAERERLDEKMRIAALVYQHSGEGMLVMDADWLTLATNPAFSTITGYGFEEVADKNACHFISGPEDQVLHANIIAALLTAGHWHGESWNQRKNGELYAKWMTVNTLKNEAGSIHGYVVLFSDITEKKKSADLIWRQANFDELTGLPNRRMFSERLQQEIKNQHRAGLALALLFIDLDHFKAINDTLGHSVGDLVLVEAGRRIAARIRESDIVARLGGDEFIVVLTQLGDKLAAERIAQSIIDALAQPFTLDNEVVHVSASIGISLYSGDAPGAAQLLSHADQAMYRSKKQGGNCFSHFTPVLQQAALSRQNLIKELELALESREFELHFQPIVNLASGCIHKAEALVRWQHPQRGLLGPLEFIAIAEESGLIIALGDWVFQESARWARQWLASAPDDFQVSINLSPVQLKGKDQQQAWLDHLEELGLPGESILLEISEGLLLGENAKIAGNLRQFRQAGVQLVIDDFGTGYSALSYLKKLDIAYLKIDKSFVANIDSDPHDRALSEVIILIAHRLGMKVIAEGVETEAQRRILVAAGCDFAQGYLFSKPLPPQQFERLLLQGQPFGIAEQYSGCSA